MNWLLPDFVLWVSCDCLSGRTHAFLLKSWKKKLNFGLTCTNRVIVWVIWSSAPKHIARGTAKEREYTFCHMLRFLASGVLLCESMWRWDLVWLSHVANTGLNKHVFQTSGCKKKKKKKNAVAICGNNLLVKFIDLRTRVFYGSFLKIMKQKSNPTGQKIWVLFTVAHISVISFHEIWSFIVKFTYLSV